MNNKPDGRMYSRIAKKSVAIIQNIYGREPSSISNIAEEIQLLQLPDFHIKRTDKQMSVSRIRDYVRFLRDIRVFEEQNGLLTLVFRPKTTDGEWAQALSDLALVYLALTLKITPPELPFLLDKTLGGLFKDNQLPTLTEVAQNIDINGGRAEETFRWAVYLYVDGEACPFDIRHYPVLLKRSFYGGQ